MRLSVCKLKKKYLSHICFYCIEVYVLKVKLKLLLLAIILFGLSACGSGDDNGDSAGTMAIHNSTNGTVTKISGEPSVFTVGEGGSGRNVMSRAQLSPNKHCPQNIYQFLCLERFKEKILCQES